ncbi:MAG: DHH family phosphoesterase [Butyricicoccaceae bacterium]
MDKRMIKILRPGVGVFFLCLLLFAAVSSVFHIGLAIAELLVCLVLYAYYKYAQRRTKKETQQYLERLAELTQGPAREAIMNFPMPVAVVSIVDGRILWWNDLFEEIIEHSDSVIEQRMSDLARGFDSKWLLEMEGAKGAYPTPVEVGEHVYEIHGSIVKQSDGGPSTLMMLYWHDRTEDFDCRKRLEEGNPVITVVSIDNYEELVKGITDSEKSKVLSDIDQKINEWANPVHGLLRKYDRDKYIFVMEEVAFAKILEEKFSVLEAMHKIVSDNGIGATLSIGIGRDGDSLEQKYEFAQLALEMALARGGDQAVIKNRFAFEFFGGASKEVEKRTKVKSRVMANALGQIIRDSPQVLIMGHKNSDMDALGAAVGMACAVRSRGRDARIVIDRTRTLAQPLIEKLDASEEYAGILTSPEMALNMADSNTLLIVVDTNRPDFCEVPELLKLVPRVAVIDHHRRAASYIEKVAVNMHEPSASSASELVCELLQYMLPDKKIGKLEAECLLAGIYLDTKGFSIKAGTRTFEAAAYLRGAGADMVDVKRLFLNSFSAYMERERIISRAKQDINGIVIAMADFQAGRAVAAQAADELLNIVGVQGSIVAFLTPEGDIAASLRSMGAVNMQAIAERLGGGGSLTASGAQMKDMTIEEAEQAIRNAVKDYFEQLSQETQEEEKS